jgi:hypothetical protein
MLPPLFLPSSIGSSITILALLVRILKSGASYAAMTPPSSVANSTSPSWSSSNHCHSHRRRFSSAVVVVVATVSIFAAAGCLLEAGANSAAERRHPWYGWDFVFSMNCNYTKIFHPKFNGK